MPSNVTGLRATATSPHDAVAIKAALDGLDHTAHQAERKWGIGRLRLLVDDLLRARFDRQCALLDDALWGTATGTEILAQIAATQRGWAALDRAATDAGHVPKPPVWIECMSPDGVLFVVVPDNADASLLDDQLRGRAASVYTADEVGRLLAKWPELALVKQAFAGATVTEIRAKRPPELFNDDLPF